ncbi:uncharacterized protein LOC142985657 isoform X2 [Anticarsia gemmatalis]|uniref:uncharacterized protein LOC142985657 isoform X2 n=1 Tax=Anticarsia gemmatalis TaxID=129554 RepID=UPI003F767C55
MEYPSTLGDHNYTHKIPIKSRVDSCFVPMCPSTSTKFPNKLFLTGPSDPKLRRKWFQAAKRNDYYSPKTVIRCCEDHFDLENDVANWMKFKMLGGKLYLKKDVLPHIFGCQNRMIPLKPRSVIMKRENRDIVESIENTADPSSECSLITEAHDSRNIEISKDKGVQIENDMENYTKYKLVGGRIKLKPGTVPHKFKCQEAEDEERWRRAAPKHKMEGSRLSPVPQHDPEDTIESTPSTPDIDVKPKYCICCLGTNNSFVNVIGCEHAEFLDVYLTPELRSSLELIVCYNCHNLLKKINAFRDQVQESLSLLTKETFPEEIEKKTSLTIAHAVEINIQPKSDEDILLSEDCIKKEETETEINKNIKTALDIIHGNATTLNYFNSDSIKNMTEAVLNMTSANFNAARPKMPEPIKLNTLAVKTELDSCQSDSEETVLPDLNSEKDMPVEVKKEIENDSDTEMLDSIELEKNDVDSISNMGESSQSEKAVSEKTDLATRHKKAQVKKVELNEKQLDKERQSKIISEEYKNYPYKCELCIIGFQFKSNLVDHCKRKHGEVKGGFKKCPICFQTVRLADYDVHNLRHFTRFDCMRCNERFVTHVEASQHFIETHIQKNTKRSRNISKQKGKKRRK